MCVCTRTDVCVYVNLESFIYIQNDSPEDWIQRSDSKSELYYEKKLFAQACARTRVCVCACVSFLLMFLCIYACTRVGVFVVIGGVQQINLFNIQYRL